MFIFWGIVFIYVFVVHSQFSIILDNINPIITLTLDVYWIAWLSCLIKSRSDTVPFETLFAAITCEFTEVFDFSYFLKSNFSPNAYLQWHEEIDEHIQTLYTPTFSAPWPSLWAIMSPYKMWFIFLYVQKHEGVFVTSLPSVIFFDQPKKNFRCISDL